MLFLPVSLKSEILKWKTLVQLKNFCKLVYDNKTKSNPEKNMFNVSKYGMSDAEK